MNNVSAAEQLIADFQATPHAAWQVVNDDVMGGVSVGAWTVTNGVARFSGDLSLENNGGFASVRSPTARHQMGQVDSFLIRVRGDGRRYKFTARMGSSFDSAIYQLTFVTKNGEWEEHRLALKDFVPSFRGRVLTGAPPLDPAKIASIGFLIADRQEGPFRLEISWIKAVGILPR
ncbi:MAG: CIA30 family protein [Limisphaerales bacterium]